MKKIVCFLCFTAVIICFSSCKDMLDVDSDRYVTVDENGLTSANDSISSILGILAGMQKIGDRYVLFGEMRADLLNVTDSTPAAMRELNDFTVKETSDYASPRDYYTIINNCNYFISRTGDAGSPLKTQNAAAHALRAWTYMQVVFNWGKAFYFTEPLLTVEDTEKEYPAYTIPQVIDALIADLEPFAEAVYPNYGDIYGMPSRYLFIPVKVLLGDLYLWRGASTGDYEKAANYYAEYINSHSSAGFPFLAWNYSNFLQQNFDKAFPSWNSWTYVTVASSSNAELVAAIQMATSLDQGTTSRLPYQYKYYTMSDVIANLWDGQNYLLHYVSGALATDYYTMGDLRKMANLYNYGQTYWYDGIKTYYILNKLDAYHTMLYRLGLIYLRYAEAVNRAGKPNTAFAVLKYGLGPTTLSNPARIPREELEDAKPYIMIFNNPKYTYTFNNAEKGTGVHSRGCGDSDFDKYYVIGGVDGEPLATRSDSILWVEDAILTELALETSFEGNRFQDLMRFAMRREDPSFLAKHVAAKHETDYSRIYNLLLDTKNWFLPENKK